MDPLSVAASVAGLLGAAGKITTVLYGLVTKIKDAPSLTRTVVTEVSDITAALGQLQAYVLGTASANPACSNLILLEQVLATLSGCVATYSELEAAVDSLNINADMGIFDRAMWTLKEPGLVAVVQRLQNHKSSLTLMLTILQWYVVLCFICEDKCRLVISRTIIGANVHCNADKVDTIYAITDRF